MNCKGTRICKPRPVLFNGDLKTNSPPHRCWRLCRCLSPRVDSVTTQPPEHRRRLPVEPTCVCTLSLEKNDSIAEVVVDCFRWMKPKEEASFYSWRRSLCHECCNEGGGASQSIGELILQFNSGIKLIQLLFLKLNTQSWVITLAMLWPSNRALLLVRNPLWETISHSSLNGICCFSHGLGSLARSI